MEDEIKVMLTIIARSLVDSRDDVGWKLSLLVRKLACSLLGVTKAI